MHMLTAPKDLVNNQIFNVGAQQENYRIRQLANIVKETVPYSKVKFAENSGPDRRSYHVDFTKLATTLPELKFIWNARSGAEQLYRAYKEIGLIRGEFEGPKYRRLEHLKGLIRLNKLDSDFRWKII